MFLSKDLGIKLAPLVEVLLDCLMHKVLVLSYCNGLSIYDLAKIFKSTLEPLQLRQQVCIIFFQIEVGIQ